MRFDLLQGWPKIQSEFGFIGQNLRPSFQSKSSRSARSSPLLEQYSITAGSVADLEEGGANFYFF